MVCRQHSGRSREPSLAKCEDNSELMPQFQGCCCLLGPVVASPVGGPQNSLVRVGCRDYAGAEKHQPFPHQDCENAED